ncbi:hypothetical protein NFHSH190041_17820 [Shewanella sp. NFH-SH190041]|uniref:phage holin n=1 Tax=Shewanella sp. NFH-SH190041 TaxID=2950245 RepID=UPI0021C49D71|nr:phage holin [Shewanella sp. NFH-SH190041]BDM64330.1 hypothetical protein NFHSH190041_17820 [Shewanella sp. NFH-SH190041]
MTQLQYVLKNLDHGEAIQRQLMDNGVAQQHIRFYSRDKRRMAKLNINAASFLEERDIPHLMLRGAVFGLLGAVLLAVVVNGALPAFGPTQTIMLTLFLTLFGIWLGGLIGFNNENYKLSSFHQELMDGESILVIDAPLSQEKIIRRTMRSFDVDIHHQHSHHSGMNPFEGWKLVHHPDD